MGINSAKFINLLFQHLKVFLVFRQFNYMKYESLSHNSPLHGGGRLMVHCYPYRASLLHIYSSKKTVGAVGIQVWKNAFLLVTPFGYCLRKKIMTQHKQISLLLIRHLKKTYHSLFRKRKKSYLDLEAVVLNYLANGTTF